MYQASSGLLCQDGAETSYASTSTMQHIMNITLLDVGLRLRACTRRMPTMDLDRYV